MNMQQNIINGCLILIITMLIYQNQQLQDKVMNMNEFSQSSTVKEMDKLKKIETAISNNASNIQLVINSSEKLEKKIDANIDIYSSYKSQILENAKTIKNIENYIIQN
jgi:septal ring factor EnvC (AmiA/AmiB activator)